MFDELTDSQRKMVSRSMKNKTKAKNVKSRRDTASKPPVQRNPQRRRRKTPLGWADLPPDLLLAVSSRLPLKSCLILPLVCTSWKNCLSNAIPPIKRKSSPWLISQLVDSCKFLGLHVGTGISFSFGPYPQLEGKVCIGSHNGWLILSNPWLLIFLFNPITESLITFPPLPAFLDDAERTPVPRRISVIKKVVFSSYPGARDFVVVAVLNLGENSAFTLSNVRSGWSTLKLSSYYCGNLHDVLCLEGREGLHIISQEARLLQLWFSKGCPYSSLVKDMCTGLRTKMPLYRDWPRKSTRDEKWDSCMVVTQDLKAYEVSRRIKRDAMDQPAGAGDISVECWSDCLCESCKIKFKTVNPGEDPSIAPVKRKNPLKEHSFFVGPGYNQMIPLPKAERFPGIRPNCVYLVNSSRAGSRPQGQCSYDLVVLDVARETIEKYCPSLSMPTWPPPLWFVPMMLEGSKKKKKKRGKRKRDDETS